MTGWHGVMAFLAGFGTACALMAWDAWAAQRRNPGKRVGSLTSVGEGREG